MGPEPTWQLQADDESSSATQLKVHLFEAYGGFADKRIRKLTKSDLFIVDDRDERRDYGADRKLYPWFCLIFARVISATLVEVELSGNWPTSPQILSWIDDGNASVKDDHNSRLVVPIQLGNEGRLRNLAQLIEAVVRPGAQYDVRSYKYVCPRTAASLRRLADVLAAAPSR